MTTDTRTAQEIAYDDLKSGAAYVKPDPELPPEVASGEMSMLRYLARWIDQHASEHLVADDAPDVRPYGCPACDTPVRLSDGCFVCVSCGEAVTPDAAVADWAFHAGERYGAHEGIRIYREGHKWDPPRRPALPSHLLALRAQIDAETDPTMRRRLICRMADQVLGLSDDEPADALTPILEDIERHFAPREAEGVITISHLYYDPRNHNDITDKPVGPLAYTDYALGADDTHVFISFDASGVLQLVSMFGHDPVDINDALGALANLQALLNDPRVQALRQR